MIEYVQHFEKGHWRIFCGRFAASFFAGSDGRITDGYFRQMQGLYLVREKQKHRWEHFEHRADIGIRGFGATKEQAFEQAAVALTAVITEPEKVEPQQQVKITLRICEDETLLVDWLNSLVYEMATRKMLFGRFKLSIDKQQLNATAWGEKTDIKKHQPTVEVKAATYTALTVRQAHDGTWVAQCVVDV